MSTETLIVETETVIATPEPPIIELKDVEVTFNSRTGSLFRPNKVYAVRGVNMRIERGQTLGIVGESGKCHVRPADGDQGQSVLQR